MKSKISHLVILLLVILMLHLIGIFAGLYENHVSIDIPQHFLAGIIFGIIWLWWLKPQTKVSLSKSIILISILGFVALLAVVWEFLEFGVWNLLPTFANSFKFYSPTIAELLGDIVTNLLGGIAVGIYAINKKKS